MSAITTTTTTTPFPPAMEQDREEYINDLAAQYGTFEKEEWKSNNGTNTNYTFIITITKMKQIGQLLTTCFQWNIASGKKPIRAVLVAGWSKDENRTNILSPLSKAGREETLTAQYGQSFTLSKFISAENADFILRIARSAHHMHHYRNKEGEWRFEISPGVTVTEAEEYLAQHGLAMPTVNTTLHVCSWVGAANANGYGPAGKKESMTSLIEVIEGYTGNGKKIRLSATENSKLFNVIVNANLGACVAMTRLTLKDIREDFYLARKNTYLKNCLQLEQFMQKGNFFHNDGDILQYFPAGVGEKDDNHTRVRLISFNETDKKPTKETALDPHSDIHEYIDLIETNKGEPAIYELVKHKDLRKFLPVFWIIAAKKTFGHENENVQIGPSAKTIHVIRTYTSLPLVDINWLIEVKDPDEARALLVNLMKLVEDKLEKLATRKDPKYPILTIFSRFLKGHYFPEGTGGVATTAVHEDGHFILSFELLSYTLLQKTGSFKMVQNLVIKHLDDNGFHYKYHPGKTWPEGLNSLTQLFKDNIERGRLERFQEAVVYCNGGPEFYRLAPMMTSQKQVLIFGDSHAEVQDPKEAVPSVPKKRTKAERSAASSARQARRDEREARRDRAIDKVLEITHEHQHFGLMRDAIDLKLSKRRL